MNEGIADMIDCGRKNVLGVKVDAIDYEAAVIKIISSAQSHTGFGVSALAVHGIMTGVMDPVHRYRLNNLDLVTPDGQPVRWALNWLHNTNLPDRVYGPQLMLKVCEEAQRQSLPIYLFGSKRSVLNALQINLTMLFPNLSIAGTEPSQFRRISENEKRVTIERIRASGAAIVFVALGCPRQEVWAYENREALSMPVIAVGAAFDFHAGNQRQAPRMMQRVGLEWLFRLLNEPMRLWQRYLLLNPYFLWLLVLQKIGARRFDPDESTSPEEELRYG